MASITWEDAYIPNRWVPVFSAIAFHALLLAWNPTILSGGDKPLTPMMKVEYRESLPPIPQPKPTPPPPKPPEKKKEKPKPAKKSGLSTMKHPAPMPIKKEIPKPVIKPKPFVSHIALPKFVPHTAEDIVAASPSPGISAPAPHRMERAPTPPPQLKTRSRGIRAADINFELNDRSSAMSANTHITAIPIAQDRGETAELPHSQALKEAPLGKKSISGYRFHPGAGMSSGELEGKDRKSLGYHGVIKTDEYESGSLSGTSGKGGKTQIGGGAELSGPVGDRKILHRKLPEYPSWAEEKGITAVVVIFFTVKPDGTLRSSMRVERSSGYPELDQLAKDALSQWKFSPTSAGSSADEAWGRITFKFTLN